METAPVYPQLAKRFDLGTSSGAWVQAVSDGGPADDAGLRGGDDRERFQASTYDVGGDVIVRLNGRPGARSRTTSARRCRPLAPGDEVPVVVFRDGRSKTITDHRRRATRGERMSDPASCGTCAWTSRARSPPGCDLSSARPPAAGTARSARAGT